MEGYFVNNAISVRWRWRYWTGGFTVPSVSLVLCLFRQSIHRHSTKHDKAIGLNGTCNFYKLATIQIFLKLYHTVQIFAILPSEGTIYTLLHRGQKKMFKEHKDKARSMDCASPIPNPILLPNARTADTLQGLSTGMSCKAPCRWNQCRASS